MHGELGELDQSPVRPGDTIAGKFLVEKLIGSGGVGVVLAARHLQLDKPVAIKFLLPKAAKNVVDVTRFCREAQATSKLKTEHVCRVLDTGVLDDGTPFMVMEHLEGMDLQQLLKEIGPIPLEQTLEFVLQASVALAEAHTLGIIHRDIKPSNLFLTERSDGTPLVKVLDFGIAKASVDALAGVGPQDLTKTSALLGSPLYMSPEQIRSTKSVDARTDIWSLGVVLYELLCGETPFDSDSLTGVVAGVIGSSPPPLGMRRADLPPALVSVITKCLEKEPKDRFQSLAELASALEPFAPESAKISIVRILRLQGVKARGESPFARTPSFSSLSSDISEPPSATARTLRSERGTTPSFTRPRPWKLGVAGAVMVSAFGSALWYGWHGTQDTTPPVLPASANNVPTSAPIDSVPTSTGSVAPITSSPPLLVVQEEEERDGGEAQGDASDLSHEQPLRPTVVRTRTAPQPAKTKPKGDAPTKIIDETVDTRR